MIVAKRVPSFSINPLFAFPVNFVKSDGIALSVKYRYIVARYGQHIQTIFQAIFFKAYAAVILVGIVLTDIGGIDIKPDRGHIELARRIAKAQRVGVIFGGKHYGQANAQRDGNDQNTCRYRNGAG